MFRFIVQNRVWLLVAAAPWFFICAYFIGRWDGARRGVELPIEGRARALFQKNLAERLSKDAWQSITEQGQE